MDSFLFETTQCKKLSSIVSLFKCDEQVSWSLMSGCLVGTCVTNSEIVMHSCFYFEKFPPNHPTFKFVSTTPFLFKELKKESISFSITFKIDSSQTGDEISISTTSTTRYDNTVSCKFVIAQKDNMDNRDKDLDQTSGYLDFIKTYEPVITIPVNEFCTSVSKRISSKMPNSKYIKVSMFANVNELIFNISDTEKITLKTCKEINKQKDYQIPLKLLTSVKKNMGDASILKLYIENDKAWTVLDCNGWYFFIFTKI